MIEPMVVSSGKPIGSRKRVDANVARITLAVTTSLLLAASCDGSGPPDVSVEGPLYEASATVLQEGDELPELCLGTIMTSLPPQCGGAPIVNWDWGNVSGEENAANTIWGEYDLTGRYDGERFEVVEVSADSGRDGHVEQSGPPQREYGRSELKDIQFYLSGVPAERRFGYELLWSDVLVDEGVVELGVDVAYPTTIQELDARYGEGVVRLVAQLIPVEG